MRLIDADVLGELADSFNNINYEDIMNQPTIEPQRMRGKWVKENVVLTSNPPQYQWHCSECGQEIHGFYDAVLANFCPNCGADMRGTK